MILGTGEDGLFKFGVQYWMDDCVTVSLVS